MQTRIADLSKGQWVLWQFDPTTGDSRDDENECRMQVRGIETHPSGLISLGLQRRDWKDDDYVYWTQPLSPALAVIRESKRASRQLTTPEKKRKRQEEPN